MTKQIIITLIGLFITCIPAQGILPFLVIPEDVSTGLAAIYGFTPKILLGRDHRYGFGFRLGSHADFQVLYEFGPQIYTKRLQQVPKIRSASYRERVYRRRPVLEFLLRAGLVREARYDVNVDESHTDFLVCDEPR